ncbi:MAG: hypothetical protein KGH53_02580 [Candidatus Micrarchaeota archaeon]|nr:hypothetical protein [Candidatus Micrarchaeota archaeon]
MMKLAVEKKESTLSNKAQAQMELEAYLNAGKSLKRWEYFMKCMTINEGSFKRGHVSINEMVRQMAKFDPEPYKLLGRMVKKYGIKDFTSASIHLFVHNREYLSQFFEIKTLPRS